MNYLGSSLIISLMANQTVVCTYRVRADAEPDFLELLDRHWRTLHELGFVTDEPSLVLRELADQPTYVEIFTWVEGGFEQGIMGAGGISARSNVRPASGDLGRVPSGGVARR